MSVETVKLKLALSMIGILLLAGGGWWFFRNRREQALISPSSQSALVSSSFTPSDGFKKLMEKKAESPRGLEIFFNQSGEMSLAETPGVQVIQGFILSFEPLRAEEPRLVISSDEGTMTFTFNDEESTFYFPEGTKLEMGSKLKVYYKEKNEKLYVVLAVGLKG